MKKFLHSTLVFFLCCIIAFMSFSPAYAGNSEIVYSTNRIELSNGDYIVEVITEHSVERQIRLTNSKTGSKTSTYYTSDNVPIFSISVNGSFTYTGSSAKATSSSATVSIYSTSASYITKSASYSSNYATATGKVSYSGTTLSKTVTLYCSATGVLS